MPKYFTLVAHMYTIAGHLTVDYENGTSGWGVTSFGSNDYLTTSGNSSTMTVTFKKKCKVSGLISDQWKAETEYAAGSTLTVSSGVSTLAIIYPV